MEKENINHKEIFFNRAEVEAAEKVCCENCFENVVFLLKDKNHEFSMGLSEILKCLKFAETEGEIPPIPPSWWLDVDERFHILR